MWDPYALPVWLVVVELPDPHVDEVVWGALPGGEELLELSDADVGTLPRQEGHSNALVGRNALEVRPEGAYQVVRGRAVIDVVCPL